MPERKKERRDYEQFYSELKGSKDGFEAAFDVFIEKVIPEKVLEKTQDIALELLKNVTAATPVNTGRARGNWNVGINSADLSADRKVPEGMSEDAITQMVMDVGTEVLGTAKPYEKVVISNNVEYIGSLERGHSSQMPDGMLGRTLELMRAKLKEGVYDD